MPVGGGRNLSKSASGGSRRAKRHRLGSPHKRLYLHRIPAPAPALQLDLGLTPALHLVRTGMLPTSTLSAPVHALAHAQAHVAAAAAIAGASRVRRFPQRPRPAPPTLAHAHADAYPAGARAFHASSRAMASEAKDLYKLLGIQKGASAKEIKSAYYGLAKKLHPDTNPDNKAKDKFMQVQEAYDVCPSASLPVGRESAHE